MILKSHSVLYIRITPPLHRSGGKSWLKSTFIRKTQDLWTGLTWKLCVREVLTSDGTWNLYFKSKIRKLNELTKKTNMKKYHGEESYTSSTVMTFSVLSLNQTKMEEWRRRDVCHPKLKKRSFLTMTEISYRGYNRLSLQIYFVIH